MFFAEQVPVVIRPFFSHSSGAAFAAVHGPRGTGRPSPEPCRLNAPHLYAARSQQCSHLRFKGDTQGDHEAKCSQFFLPEKAEAVDAQGSVTDVRTSQDSMASLNPKPETLNPKPFRFMGQAS